MTAGAKDGSQGKKTFWALEVIAGYFPDFDEWLERHHRRGRCRAFMEAAQRALERLPEAAIRDACRRLLWEEPVPHVRLPFVVARLANELTAGRKAVLSASCQDVPDFSEAKAVISDLLQSLRRIS